MMRLHNFSNEKLLEKLKDACIKESLLCYEVQCYPDNNDLVKHEERDEMVTYLLEVSDREDMQLSSETFSLCVALLDRFLATYKVRVKYLECLAVACLYIASKVREEDEKVSITAEFLVDCDCKCSVSELLRMELMVLTKFQWSVDDITAIEFMQLYHGILVNEYLSTHEKEEGELDHEIAADGSILPPDELNFLDVLEHKMKQVLCVAELTKAFKPRVLALSLLSMQLAQNYPVEQMLKSIQTQTRVTSQMIDECSQQISLHLNSLEVTKTLLDRYMFEYDLSVKHRNRLSVAFGAYHPIMAASCAAVTPLSAIKEEEEEEEAVVTAKEPECLSELKHFDFICDSISYADIVMGIKNEENQKRKLNSTSMDEDYYICDYDDSFRTSE